MLRAIAKVMEVTYSICLGLIRDITIVLTPILLILVAYLIFVGKPVNALLICAICVMLVYINTRT